MPVISWNTHKVANGYEWRVYSVEYQQPSQTLKSGIAKTHPIATRLAQQWTMYLKAQARTAA